MFSKLGLQLYTVRDLIKEPNSLDSVFEKLAELGYTEAQSAGSESCDMAKAARKHGISIVGTHYNYDKIKNDVENTVKLHEMLGVTNLGLGAMPGWAHEDQDSLFRFIEEMNKTASIYAPYGMKLTYHNHSFEFSTLDGKKTVMEYLYEGFDKNNISFVLDTCWVANAGADVCDWIEKLEGRLDILHLKDIKSITIDGWNTRQEMCEVGRGLIAWDRVIATAEKTGVKHYVVEQDGGWIDNDPFKSLEVSKKYLEKYLIH